MRKAHGSCIYGMEIYPAEGMKEGMDVMTQELQEILRHVDHTLLATTATWEDIRRIVDEGVLYQTASVCIPACYVKPAAGHAEGRVRICTVIGFPNGYDTTAAKVFMAEDAVKNGADEVDMVINIGYLKAGCFRELEEEIAAVKAACGKRILKVIIETCALTEEEKIAMCGIVTRTGADYIKTSTGFGGGGATFEDVKLFAAHVGPGVRIKAAGGISSIEDAKRFLELGADRLGTSRIVRIAKGLA